MIGSDALVRRLNWLDLKVKKKIVKATLAKASTPIVRAMRARVPVETGLLKKSIGKRPRSYRGGDVSIVVIGPRRGFVGQTPGGEKRVATKYAHIIERGAKPHSQPKHWWFRSHKHPGVAKRPFVEPSVTATASQVAAIIETELRDRIEREA